MEGRSPSRSVSHFLSLFLMRVSVVKCGRLWLLNSKINFSELFTPIPTQTYGPEMSPENYLVSQSSMHAQIRATTQVMSAMPNVS